MTTNAKATLTTGAISASATGDGSGGFISVVAGKSGTGTLAIDGSINADAHGASGSGGYVALNAPTITALACPMLRQNGKRLRISQGTVIVEHRGKVTEISVGKATVELRGTVIAKLEHKEGSVAITNAMDTARNSLIVRTATGRQIAVAPGERVAIGMLYDYVPKRGERTFGDQQESGGEFSEVSLPYLMSNDELFKLFFRGEAKAFSQLLRMAACLQVMQSNHGPYR